jgi:hypothetical protein
MRPLHRVLRRGLLIGLAVLALTGAVVPAGSAAQAQAETEEAVCATPIIIGAYQGFHICNMPPLRITYRNRYHYFLPGSDRQVYYIWQRYPGDTVYSGFHSLGGQAYSMVTPSYFGSGIKIYVHGRDPSTHRDRPYCKVYAPGNGWGPWYGCDNG